MNRTLTTDIISEYAGDVTESEAIELLNICEENGIFDESHLVNIDDDTWNQYIIRAVERSGNRKM